MTILHFSYAFRISDRLAERAALQRCCLKDCRGACCLHGVWMDPLERQDLLAHASLIAPRLKADRADPSGWFSDQEEPEPFFPSGRVVSSTVCKNPDHYGGTECVFLRADWKCALQTAAVECGEEPWRWKPFHCIVHPLTFDSDGRITLAPDDELLGEEGSCFRKAAASSRLEDLLAPELAFLRSFPISPDGQPRGADPR